MTVKCAPLFMIWAATALFAEAKVDLSRLPAAVRNTIAEETKAAQLNGVAKEREHGKTVYEVETTANGRSRDLLISPTGEIISIEEEVGLETLPAAAKAAIERRVAQGKIKKVELLIQGGKRSYEAAYVTKTGMNLEFNINSDGSIRR